MGDERQRRLDWKFITASAAPFAGTCIAARQKSHDVRRQRPFTASEAVVRIASLGFLPADHSDSLEIHRNCEFTEMRRRRAKRKELCGNHLEYVHKINGLTVTITIWCRGICATSAYPV